MDRKERTAGPVVESVSPRKGLVWRKLKANRASLVALIFILFLAVVAVVGPYLTPHHYDAHYSGAERKPPLWYGEAKRTEDEPAANYRFLLGTDVNGRDTFSRLIFGTRVSLGVGVVATSISLLIGLVVGLLSGYFGGWVDAVLMRFTDTIFAFPSVLLAVAITAVSGRPSIGIVFLALGLVGWTGLARLVRSQVLTIKNLDYVHAARSLGAGHLRILLFHILPNSMGPIIVATSLGVGGAILGEAGLSFLGLGVQEPIPSWGLMLGKANQSYQHHWWLAVFPGLAIVCTVLAFNLFGDGLRDALDPRAQK